MAKPLLNCKSGDPPSTAYWNSEHLDRGVGSVEAAYKLVTADVPLGRPAEPEEVAGVICLLASSDASMVSGTCVLVGGGGSAVDVPTLAFACREKHEPMGSIHNDVLPEADTAHLIVLRDGSQDIRCDDRWAPLPKLTAWLRQAYNRGTEARSPSRGSVGEEGRR